MSHDSTTVTITVNSFVKENILLSEFSGQLPLEKKSQLTMVIAIVRVSLYFFALAHLPFKSVAKTGSVFVRRVRSVAKAATTPKT